MVQKSENNIVEAKVLSVRAVSVHTVDVLDETLESNFREITQEQFIGHDWSKIPGINSRVEVKLPKDGETVALYKGFTVKWLYELEFKDKSVLTDCSREKIMDAHGEKSRKKAQKSNKIQEQMHDPNEEEGKSECKRRRKSQVRAVVPAENMHR